MKPYYQFSVTHLFADLDVPTEYDTNPGVSKIVPDRKPLRLRQTLYFTANIKRFCADRTTSPAKSPGDVYRCWSVRGFLYNDQAARLYKSFFRDVRVR